ncbi:aspartate-alanine antiporter [Burkholderia semiarida]|uniref:aspartate-alanine antiporter n=1 Tax=Burkholderia semiarida TaxID=2843303 RepID=UPI0038781DB4
MIEFVHGHQAEISLFACIAVGYLIGLIRIGPISPGNVCGTLIAALAIGQTGVRVAPDLRNIAFSLFLFALGFLGGPQFFANIGRGWRYGVLSLIEVVSTVIVACCAVIVLRLDAGTAAGLFAGGATESAVIGTASDAVSKLGLAAADVSRLQANIATAYSICYLFGLLTILVFTSQLAPFLLRIDLKSEAGRVWHKFVGANAISEHELAGLPPIVSRAVTVGAGSLCTIECVEQRYRGGLTIERVLRRGECIDADPDVTLQRGDVALITGRRDAVVAALPHIGDEIAGKDAFGTLKAKRADVVVRRDLDGFALLDLYALVPSKVARGLHVASLSRNGASISLRPETVLRCGDLLTVTGSPYAIEHHAKHLGDVFLASHRTDIGSLALGVLTGMALGHVTVHAGAMSISVGAGGGCLLSGLLFGWLRTRRRLAGQLPSAAAEFLKDFGLAAFVAAIGMSAGPDALHLVRSYGVALPVAGVLMALVPGVLSLWIGTTVLKLEAPMLLGGIAGQQCSTPAISALIDIAGNSAPLIGYTITYAISNVVLPLAGPVMVALAARIG